MDVPSGYRTQARDTAPWAEAVLFERWRAMEPGEKLRLMGNINRAVHRLHLAGLAQRYPEASAEELEIRAACQLLGTDVVAKVRGEDRIPPDLRRKTPAAE